MTRTDRWLRWLYGLYAPVYDLALARFTRPGRRRAIGLLGLRPGARVLVPACGTGLDFAHLPPGVLLAAGDFAPPMVARARRAATAAGFPDADVRGLDATALPYPDGAFDAVVLHLIVAVVPEPLAVLREARRVLAPGGRISVFDKFVPDGGRRASCGARSTRSRGPSPPTSRGGRGRSSRRPAGRSSATSRPCSAASSGRSARGL